LIEGHQLVRAGYCVTSGSGVRTVRPWTIAWLTRIRSNGSRCRTGSRATCNADSSSIGSGANPGKRVEFECVLIFDVEDGLIKRERRISDFTGVLIQLGVLRGKPAC